MVQVLSVTRARNSQDEEMALQRHVECLYWELFFVFSPPIFADKIEHGKSLKCVGNTGK